MNRWIERSFAAWEKSYGKRFALFLLAISPLVYVPVFLVTMLVLGLNLLPFNAFVLGESWTEIVWPLGEKFWLGAMIGTGSGLVLSLLRVPFLASAIGVFFVFTGFASLSVGLGFFIGEVLLNAGLSLKRNRKTASTFDGFLKNAQLDLATGLGLFMLSGFLEFYLIELAGGGYGLSLRRLQFGCLIVIALSLWTLTKMVFFHFYWQRHK